MLPFPPITEPFNPDQPLVDALVTLRNRNVDTRISYEKLLEKTEPDALPIVQKFLDLHAAQAPLIAKIMQAKGYPVEEESSIIGSINRAVVAVRCYFEDVDADVRVTIHSREDQVLTAFADALAQPMPEEDAVQLAAMRDDLVSLLAQHPAPV